MDLHLGYWQVKMTKDAKDKTSFYGEDGGLWHFTVMTFGLCSGQTIFERPMECILGQILWQICLCYLDDILIFSQTVNQHLEHLQAVLKRLREAHLKLKPKKCHFFEKQVSFLRHVVSEEGISTYPEKVQKIVNSPALKDGHDLRSALGIFIFYRRFSPHFSELAKPMTKLTEKDRSFQWNEEQQKAFQDLYEILSQASIICCPTYTPGREL